MTRIEKNTMGLSKEMIQDKIEYDIYFKDDGRWENYGDYLNNQNHKTFVIMDWNFSPIITFFGMEHNANES